MAARKVVLGATAMLVVVALAWAAIASLQSASQEKAHTLGDYLLAQPFDVTTEGDWVASDEELDVSGVAIQFGIRGRF